MTPGSFTEEDKKKVIAFLNMIATYATFTLKTPELIQYFKLLSHMQQTVLPKIDANILEILAVVKSNENDEGKE